MTPILECRDLTKCYGKGARPALDHVNLKLMRGRIIGLLGPNGSGKTTLIKLANGLLSANGGEILVDGKSIGIKTRRIVSYLPERNSLDLSMTVDEAVRYFQDFYPDFDVTRAYEMLQNLQIDPKAKLKTLSKGNKEKVQLILVMSRRAQLYILDEPIGGVDPAARDYILQTIISNYDENATVLISTHLIADVESILDEVVFIKNGQIVLYAPVDAIREENGKSVDALFREVFKC